MDSRVPNLPELASVRAVAAAPMAAVLKHEAAPPPSRDTKAVSGVKNFSNWRTKRRNTWKISGFKDGIEISFAERPRDRVVQAQLSLSLDLSDFYRSKRFDALRYVIEDKRGAFKYFKCTTKILSPESKYPRTFTIHGLADDLKICLDEVINWFNSETTRLVRTMGRNEKTPLCVINSSGWNAAQGTADEFLRSLAANGVPTAPVPEAPKAVPAPVPVTYSIQAKGFSRDTANAIMGILTAAGGKMQLADEPNTFVFIA